MKTFTHEEVARRAYQIWLDHGSPAGRDTDIWLQAEHELAAGEAELETDSSSHEVSQTASESRGAAALAERVKGEMASESAAEFHISPPIPEQEAIKAALQKKQARAPEVPRKTAPKAPPSESGKPLWNQPHSA